MKQSWQDYESSARRGPLSIFFKVLFPLILVVAILMVFGKTCSFVNEGFAVVQDEFGPRALLGKYEWFKDSAATLEKKQADIKVYDSRFSLLQGIYKDVPRKEWAREDREQMNIWASEVAGIKASYNSLAAEYNAQMVKFNWRFTNVGDLPAGATEPLPREFKPYIDN